MYALLPNSFFAINSASGLKAALLTTNVKNTEDIERNYEILLTDAEDLFIHTWSLCVEIQWYLLVPVLFIVQRTIRVNGMVFFIGIGLASLIYNLFSNDSTAFNSIFARIWQFASGVTVHFITNGKKSNLIRVCDDKLREPLLQDANNNEGKTIEKLPSELKHLFPYIANFLFSLILVTFSWSTEEPHHLRIEMSVLTAILIAIGEYHEILVLSNPIMNYIGNISYSLYLVHWPVYVVTKYFYQYSQIALAIGVFLSFLITIIVYHAYEKPYLKLSGKSIFSIIGILFVVTIILSRENLMVKLLGKADKFDAYNIDISQGDPSTNITVAIAMNHLEGKTNIGISRNAENCTHIKLTQKVMAHNYGICEYREKLQGELLFLVIGNSYACNQGGIIFGEFKNYSKKFIISCQPACEVLSDKQRSGCADRINQTKVFETVRPDILFIVQKIFIGKKPYDKDKPLEDDEIYQTHFKKLKYFERAPWVKKIYILTAFPSCVKSCASSMVNWMKDENKLLRFAGDRFTVYDDEYGRARYEKLVKTCKKCALIDYKDILKNKNGQITMYDDSTNLLYIDNLGHFTKYGRDRLRPVYKELADRFAVEFNEYLKPKQRAPKKTRRKIPE